MLLLLQLRQSQAYCTDSECLEECEYKKLILDCLQFKNKLWLPYCTRLDKVWNVCLTLKPMWYTHCILKFLRACIMTCEGFVVSRWHLLEKTWNVLIASYDVASCHWHREGMLACLSAMDIELVNIDGVKHICCTCVYMWNVFMKGSYKKFISIYFYQCWV